VSEGVSYRAAMSMEDIFAVCGLHAERAAHLQMLQKRRCELTLSTDWKVSGRERSKTSIAPNASL
jgi:hypothetical protein